MAEEFDGAADAPEARGTFADWGAGTERARESVAVVPVVEEELRVVERPVEEVVRLREERVNVERRPVNRAVTDADLNAFREGSFELRERSEEAVVDKTARVVEEVAVNKEVAERSETVRDTVRSTDVNVEETGGVKVRGASASASDNNPNRRDR